MFHYELFYFFVFIGILFDSVDGILRNARVFQECYISFIFGHSFPVFFDDLRKLRNTGILEKKFLNYIQIFKIFLLLQLWVNILTFNFLRISSPGFSIKSPLSPRLRFGWAIVSNNMSYWRAQFFCENQSWSNNYNLLGKLLIFMVCLAKGKYSIFLIDSKCYRADCSKTSSTSWLIWYRL